MAIAVIGGVTVSTFLTLFVVPCAYSLLSRLESRKHDDELKLALEAMGELGPSPVHEGVSAAHAGGNGHAVTEAGAAKRDEQVTAST